MAATTTPETTTYDVLDAEWREAVAARNGHDARVRRILDSIGAGCDRGREQVRRQEGAKRAHLTRRIIRAEKAIEAAGYCG